MCSRLFARVVSIATIVAACAAVLATTVVAAGSTPPPHLFGTSTTAPTRPTVAIPRPTTPPTLPAIPGRPTSTTTATTTTTAPPPTTAVDVATPPTAPPATLPTLPTSPPATSPPVTQEVETASQVVEPASTPPGLLPPVITFVSATCAGQNSADGAITATIHQPPENSWLYDATFPAEYSWELLAGNVVVDDGTSTSDEQVDVIHVPDLEVAVYELVVADALFPELVDVAEATVTQCGFSGVLPPTLEFLGITCPDLQVAELIVGDPGGDDGSHREYELVVTDAADAVIATALRKPGDGAWQDFEFAADEGTYQVTATDQADPALTAVVGVVIPPCDPSPGPDEDAAPLLAPVIVGVHTDCMTPAANGGAAHIDVVDPNLGDSQASAALDYTVSSGSTEVAAGSVGDASPTAEIDIALFAGDYEATISWAADPSLSASVSFLVPLCAIPADIPTDPVVSVLWSVCDPYVVSRTLVSVWYPDPTFDDTLFHWSLFESAVLDGTGSFQLDGGDVQLLGFDALSSGSYLLTVHSYGVPGLHGEATFSVPECQLADPVDPVDPTEPVTDPTDPTQPADPTDPVVDPTQPADPTNSTDPAAPGGDPTVATGSTPPVSPPIGNLPATGTGAGVLVIVGAALIIAGATALIAVDRRRVPSDRR